MYKYWKNYWDIHLIYILIILMRGYHVCPTLLTKILDSAHWEELVYWPRKFSNPDFISKVTFFLPSLNLLRPGGATKVSCSLGYKDLSRKQDTREQPVIYCVKGPRVPSLLVHALGHVQPRDGHPREVDKRRWGRGLGAKVYKY